MREHAGRKRLRARARLWVPVVIAAAVLWGSAGHALAHKGKLPDDALALVRQAAALLAQDPTMLGEAMERLGAALNTKNTAGVDLVKVRQAREALLARNIPATRQALAEAVPSGPSAPPPMSPGGAPPAAQPSPPGVASEPRAAPPDPMAQMKMAEPLVVRYAGAPAETAIVLVGAALAVVGVASLRRGR
jgi:hypothetical protein